MFLFVPVGVDLEPWLNMAISESENVKKSSLKKLSPNY